MALASLLQRLHGALLPDYSRRAKCVWWLLVAGGGCAFGWSLGWLMSQPGEQVLQVLIGVALAVVASVFPVSLPRAKSAFTVSEVFVFMLLFTHGAPAAVLAATAEAAVATARVSKRWSSRLGSPAMCALSMAAAGALLQSLLSYLEAMGLRSAPLVVIAALWASVVQFLINSVLVSTQLRLKRREWPNWADIAGNFGITATVNATGACAAAVLSFFFQDSSLSTIIVVGPPLAVLLAVLHAFFKQQEANRAIAEAAARAAQREAQITAEHLQQMHHIAFHDQLTGLPNRRRFQEALQEVVDAARADPREPFAVMFLDFDRFKVINDTLGHAAGDEFLTLVARRITGCLSTQDLVARLGGDEFAVLLRGSASLQAVVEVATRIQDAVSQPYPLAGTEIRSSASIGITMSALGYTQPGDVLRDADMAMYRAKAAGKARHVVFDHAMHAQSSRRARLEGDLRQALAAATVHLAYQPVYDLAEERLIGLEALARWTHPELGPIEPMEFVSIAEESALIVELTDLVLGQACADLRRWHARGDKWSTLKVQVNVSDKDVAQRTLLQRVKAALMQHPVPPERLTLELTEPTLMRRLGSERQSLEELHRFGIGLSIDDFGLGFSSIAHLSSLPLDSLKIDRSFVAGLITRPRDAIIVRTILDLGRSLGLPVVAEGVENAVQLTSLRSLGCRIAQGNHLSPPLSALAVDALLDRLEMDRTPALADGPLDAARLFH